MISFRSLARWFLFLGLVFISSSLYALEKRIEKVEVYPAREQTTLIIRLNRPSEPIISWIPGDRERMVISFKGFSYRATLRKMFLQRNDIWEVRGGQYTKEEARVVVEFFFRRLPYDLIKRDGGKTLVFQFYYGEATRNEPSAPERKLLHIDDVKVKVSREAIRVEIVGDSILNPKVSWVKVSDEINQLILDFHGFAFRKQSLIKEINTLGVLGLQVLQFTPDITRVIVGLQSDRVNYKLDLSPSRTRVILSLFPRAQELRPPGIPKPDSGRNETWASKKVTLEFRDADIKDVFRALAKAADINVIVDPEVSGSITVSFKDVPFGQAFDWLLKMSNLGFRNLGNTLVIGKEEKLRELFDRKDTRVFVLSNAIASAIVNTVSSMSGVSNVIVDPRMNALVVKASPQEMKKVEEIINLVDKEVPQVIVEARLVGISLESGKSLSFILSNMSKGKFYNINIMPGSEITISYSSDESASAAFDATINAWVSSGRARVLASPSVATLSGMKAVINLTRDYKYYSRVEEIQDNERTITQKWETITYGPQLVITPYIGEEGKITLDIDIDVSIVTRWIEYRDQRVPEIGHRKVTTKLRVKDGQPIIIGGLITEEDLKNLYKVPLLGDLPFIGTLFRSETSSRSREEVVLIVTPRILKN